MNQPLHSCSLSGFLFRPPPCFATRHDEELTLFAVKHLLALGNKKVTASMYIVPRNIPCARWCPNGQSQLNHFMALQPVGR